MTTYTERTLREKARKIGLQVKKGPAFDSYGRTSQVGYMVIDMTSNAYVLGPQSQNSGYEWGLDDVEEYLRNEYKRRGFEF